jgi:hypothetical protein
VSDKVGPASAFRTMVKVSMCSNPCTRAIAWFRYALASRPKI